MSESICYTCRHFRQTAPLAHTISGYCAWTNCEALPAWVDDFLKLDDYYGPRRDVGRGAYSRSRCAAHEAAPDSTVAKRRSEEWYD